MAQPLTAAAAECAEVRLSLAKLDAEIKAARAACGERLANFGAEGVTSLQCMTAATRELAAAQRHLGEALAVNAQRARDILRPDTVRR